jgi:hypothetical protein
MLLLLAIPVLASVALAHRFLQTYAPSNVLVRRVRSARPRLGVAAGLIGTAMVLLAMVHVVASAAAAGAPGWLNVVVLVLAWDAIKFSLAAVGIVCRRAARAVFP